MSSVARGAVEVKRPFMRTFGKVDWAEWQKAQRRQVKRLVCGLLAAGIIR